VYHFVLFIYFAIKLEGTLTLRSAPVWKKCTRCFEVHTCESTFSTTKQDNSKNKIEWQTQRWTIVPDLHH